MSPRWSFTDRQTIAETTASMLLEVEAVHFNVETPYTLTSGKCSPAYIDGRKLISYPRLRSNVIDFALSTIYREIGFEKFDSVAGGETAGIAYAAWVADALGLPMQYIRKKPKGFGRNAQIEGHLRTNSRVLLVEDLATDGGSKVNFCNAIREADAVIEDIFVIFYYGVFASAEKTLADLGLKLHYLATWQDVLAVSRKLSYFSKQTLDEVERFLSAPDQWSKDHGGA